MAAQGEDNAMLLFAQDADRRVEHQKNQPGAYGDQCRCRNHDTFRCYLPGAPGAEAPGRIMGLAGPAAPAHCVSARALFASDASALCARAEPVEASPAAAPLDACGASLLARFAAAPQGGGCCKSGALGGRLGLFGLYGPAGTFPLGTCAAAWAAASRAAMHRIARFLIIAPSFQRSRRKGFGEQHAARCSVARIGMRGRDRP
jgi:hypothetical protein